MSTSPRPVRLSEDGVFLVCTDVPHGERGHLHEVIIPGHLGDDAAWSCRGVGCEWEAHSTPEQRQALELARDQWAKERAQDHLAARLYPDGEAATGALSGAAKAEAVDVIATYEGYRRALFIGRTAAELLASVPIEPDWIVPSVIARGWTVKIAAREKAGKGTLAHYLIAKLERGEETVFGPATRHGALTTLVLTEEPDDSTREKLESFGTQRARLIQGWELGQLSWDEKVQILVDAAVAGDHKLVFVDNISRATGVSEDDENGTTLARMVEKLGDALRSVGVSLLIDHHHKKSESKVEDRSRGGTALAGACENNIDIVIVGNAYTSRTRKLHSRGRVRAANWVKQIRLNDDGLDYTLDGDSDVHSDNPDDQKAARQRELERGDAERILGKLGDAGGQRLSTNALHQLTGGARARVLGVMARLANDPCEPVWSEANLDGRIVYWYDSKRVLPMPGAE